MGKRTSKQIGGGPPSTKSTGLKLVTPTESLEYQVDRLGELRARLAAHAVLMAPWKHEAEAVEAKLLERYASTPADQIVVAEGNLFTVKIGARADEQSVIAGGMKKILGWVGAEKFLERAKITLESLKGILNEEQYKEVVTRARTGRRSLTVVAKVAAGPPQAA